MRRHTPQLVSLTIIVKFLLLVHNAAGEERKSDITLFANFNIDSRILEGEQVVLTCANNLAHKHLFGSMKKNLRILRRRRNQNGHIEEFEDMANVGNIQPVDPNGSDIKCTFTISRADDEATFICGDAESLLFETRASTASLSLHVQYSPRDITIHSIPQAAIKEKEIQVIICETDAAGANPAVNISWNLIGPFGGREPLRDDMNLISTVSPTAGSGFFTQSNLTIKAHRQLNGHRVECIIENVHGALLFRQSRTLEVIFAPISVQIHSTPSIGVHEGEVVVLTCAVAISHTPATVSWFEIPSSTVETPDTGQELTDLAYIDMTPGEYGGVLVDSTLSVSKTYRLNQDTKYRCVVRQAALEIPIVAEYKLVVLYPPSVELMSLPRAPSELESVTLSCIPHGGNPSDQLEFSWWFTKHSTALENVLQLRKVTNPIDAKVFFDSLNSSQLAFYVSQMTQIVNQSGRHLNIDRVDVNSIGWYGCQVSNFGGNAQSILLLCVNYAPKIRSETKFITQSQPGYQAELILLVSAIPALVDSTWFWIGDDSPIAMKARRHIISQDRQSLVSRDTDAISSLRIRSATSFITGLDSLKPIDPSSKPWIGRVRQSTTANGLDQVNISLRFITIVDTDFGVYLCQLRHKAGRREFYFDLKRKTNFNGGIDPKSIKVTVEGNIVLLKFDPPNRSMYTQVLLRVCYAGQAQSIQRPINDPFLRPVVQRGEQSYPVLADSRVETTAGMECMDYEVALVELGYIQLVVERSVTDYSFQFLIYFDEELKQITKATKFDGDVSESAGSSRIVIQIIIGVLVSLLIFSLVFLIVYYFSAIYKQKGLKQLTANPVNSYISGPNIYQTLLSNKNGCLLNSRSESINADLGSMQPLYPRQSIGSSCHSAMGYFQQHMIHSPTNDSGFQCARTRCASPGANSQVSALAQKIMSEVYAVAANVTSMAMSESIASGSLDFDATGERRDNNGFRPISQYAESGSITGGSISGAELLGTYQSDTLRKMHLRQGMPGNYNNAAPCQPNYRPQSGHFTSPDMDYMYQSIQRRRQLMRSPHRPFSPLPLFTSSATLRLNEAANALAAAATAAVLEASQRGQSERPPDVSTLGGSINMQMATPSSDDGESISSCGFFTKKQPVFNESSHGNDGSRSMKSCTQTKQNGNPFLPISAISSCLNAATNQDGHPRNFSAVESAFSSTGPPRCNKLLEKSRLQTSKTNMINAEFYSSNASSLNPIECDGKHLKHGSVLLTGKCPEKADILGAASNSHTSEALNFPTIIDKVDAADRATVYT